MNGHNHYLTSLNRLVLLMLKGDPKVIGTKHGIESTVILQQTDISTSPFYRKI